MLVKITKNGPYHISGKLPLQIQEIVPNRHGESWEWKAGKTFETENEYYLCRCGQSKNKPFCDDSHLRVSFNGEETASRLPYAKQAEKMEGQTLVLNDAEHLCAFARFCDAHGQIWGQMEQTEIPEARNLVIREAGNCPSGRLVAQDRKTHQAIEPEFEPSIGLVEDPAEDCSGGLWVRGGVAIQSEDGYTYETRNRVTLCRCGASENKPFCDGTHASMKFKDGLG